MTFNLLMFRKLRPQMHLFIYCYHFLLPVANRYILLQVLTSVPPFLVKLMAAVLTCEMATNVSVLLEPPEEYVTEASKER